MEENTFKPSIIEVDEKGNISYIDSNGLSTMSKENLAKYISNNYCNNNKLNREDILKDLAVFKNLRKTLELELRNYEAFIKSIIFIVTILSFAISSILNMTKLDNSLFLSIVILLASIAYIVWGSKYAAKIVDKKDGTGRLDVIDYAINVLEIKLEEIDRDERNKD
ncbi:MAG: hypothetical protein QP763_08480 [Peptoniphilus duerdenii]|uniref:hypothetical protein n=1 Tax=Peptoniphilus duerdenii TaxID=507750 RepID=UPI0025508EB5|nr:hypothetical protein [Peptoniphilus duerdenii]MDK8277072.1 hypothetical protein [Peptoniphilus duerdenii]